MSSAATAVTTAMPPPLRLATAPDNESTGALYSKAVADRDVAKITQLIERTAAAGRSGAGAGAGAAVAPEREWIKEPGKNYYINTRTGERTFEIDGDEMDVVTIVPKESSPSPSPGPTSAAVSVSTHVSGSMSGSATADHPAGFVSQEAQLTDFVSIADAYGHAARLARSEVRNASSTIELRRASNFVKDGPIRTTIAFWIHTLNKQRIRPTLNIMDLCCGRGQDFDKYRRAARDSTGSIDKLVGVDIAGGEAANSAKQRWSQCAQLQISTSELQYSFRSVLMGGTLVADLSKAHPGMIIPEAARAAGWDTDSYPEIGSCHVVSCMFAMHYFFKDEHSFRNLVLGAGWYLREGGFFVLVHADGESIAAHHTKGKDEPIHIGQATIRFHPHTLSMLDGEVSPDHRPFGWSYDFHLPQAVENVTEYLVHSPTRDRIMEEYHLVKVFDEAADVTLLSMNTVPFWKEAFAKSEVDCSGTGRCSEETMDHLSIYRVVIYAKSPLKTDIHAVRKFLRTKMGFGE